jgi:ATP:ADP antiporter, AAA family
MTAVAAPAPGGASPGQPAVLDRVLRVFGDVRPGEAVTVLMMLFSLFLLLVGYAVAKVVREPLILTTGGAEMASYASAAQALTLMGFVPLYGWLASRVDRLRLITFFLLFFLACVELFNLGLRVRVPYLGFVFFVWVGIFSLATIAQFWSYANDVHTQQDGERLFPIIAIGATAGSPLGAKIASILFREGVSPANMLHITALLLLCHLGLYWLVNERLQARPAVRRAEAKPLGKEGGFALVAKSRYLMLAAVVLVILNIVNTTGEYLNRRFVSAAADQATADPEAREAFIGGVMGDYQFAASVGAVILQAFVASRLVRLAGFPGVIMALPLISLSAYSIVAAGAGFALFRWAKISENATDYSIMNTARHMLWLPTTREEKYKAKQALDTFFVRAGDLLSAGIVFVGTAWLSLSVRGFALVNVVLALVWLALAWKVAQENRRLRDAQAATSATAP